MIIYYDETREKLTEIPRDKMFHAIRTEQNKNFIHVGKHVRSNTGDIRYIKKHTKKRETLDFSAFTNIFSSLVNISRCINNSLKSESAVDRS